MSGGFIIGAGDCAKSGEGPRIKPCATSGKRSASSDAKGVQGTRSCQSCWIFWLAAQELNLD